MMVVWVTNGTPEHIRVFKTKKRAEEWLKSKGYRNMGWFWRDVNYVKVKEQAPSTDDEGEGIGEYDIYLEKHEIIE